MYYVYFLKSLKNMKNKNFYTGYTNDLRKRLKEHNEGKVFSTRSWRPFRVIYYEGYLDEDDAKRREKYLKSGMGKRDLRNRLRSYLEKV